MSAVQIPAEPLDHALRLTIRLAGLALLLWALLTQVPSGPGAARLASWLLIGVLGLSWVGWVAGTRLRDRRLLGAAIFGLSLSGGGLVGVVPMGMVGPAVAGLAGGVAFAGWPLVGLGVLGPVTALISVAAAGRPLGYAAGAAAAAYTGLMGGISRRQYAVRARQAGELVAAEARAEVERARADVLAERNQLARDLHDVLAHSLGALAVQLEAVDALAHDAHASQGVRDGLRKSRSLVTDGLAEARRAVQALREEPVGLVDRIRTMATEEAARLEVAGTERPVPPQTGVALVRVAQESLTNARKHAVGSSVSIRLEFAAQQILLTVTNSGGGAPSSLATSGSQLGLQGMRERIGMLGGQFDAGATTDGWEVRAAVPG